MFLINTRRYEVISVNAHTRLFMTSVSTPTLHDGSDCFSDAITVMGLRVVEALMQAISVNCSVSVGYALFLICSR